MRCALFKRQAPKARRITFNTFSCLSVNMKREIELTCSNTLSYKINFMEEKPWCVITREYQGVATQLSASDTLEKDFELIMRHEDRMNTLLGQKPAMHHFQQYFAVIDSDIAQLIKVLTFADNLPLTQNDTKEMRREAIRMLLDKQISSKKGLIDVIAPRIQKIWNEQNRVLGRNDEPMKWDGGAKLKARFNKTNKTLIGKDGIKRVVYSKNGKDYVKKRDARTGKFAYTLVKKTRS